MLHRTAPPHLVGPEALGRLDELRGARPGAERHVAEREAARERGAHGGRACEAGGGGGVEARSRLEAAALERARGVAGERRVHGRHRRRRRRPLAGVAAAVCAAIALGRLGGGRRLGKAGVALEQRQRHLLALRQRRRRGGAAVGAGVLATCRLERRRQHAAEQRAV